MCYVFFYLILLIPLDFRGAVCLSALAGHPSRLFLPFTDSRKIPDKNGQTP